MPSEEKRQIKVKLPLVGVEAVGSQKIKRVIRVFTESNYVKDSQGQ